MVRKKAQETEILWLQEIGIKLWDADKDGMEPEAEQRLCLAGDFRGVMCLIQVSISTCAK